jgi:hypothetical protein
MLRMVVRKARMDDLIECRLGSGRIEEGKLISSTRDVERGKCYVLRYCGIEWMELLNNCHSVSAERERTEEADQLGAESDQVFYQLSEKTMEF